MDKTFKDQYGPIVRWIDYAILGTLCIFCYLYVRYSGRSFAETSVQFSFLNFPVFIGEFVLAGCLVLFLVRMFLARESFQKWQAWALAFLVFILGKALWGYIHWGPLALRDAALFYYLMFAVFGYVCFRREFFNKWAYCLIYAAVLGLAFDAQFNEYWLMPRILLGLLLAIYSPDRRIGVLMMAAVLLSTPFKLFLDTSRSVIVGNYFSVIALVLLSSVFVASKKRSKFLLLVLFFSLGLGAYLFCFSGNRAAKGLLAFDQLNSARHEMETFIDTKKENYKPRQVEAVMIYSPNQPIIMDDRTIEPSPIVEPPKEQRIEDSPTYGMKLGNSVFRLLIWKDALDVMGRERKVLGIDFGKPFRSENIEIVRAAVDEWKRDGWIAMHNSFLNIIYRSGIVGAVLIISFIWIYLYMISVFIRVKSWAGLLLCASMIVPFVAANFAVTLEVPYNAIPVWTLFGLTLGFAKYKLNPSRPVMPGAGEKRADPHCS